MIQYCVFCPMLNGAKSARDFVVDLDVLETCCLGHYDWGSESLARVDLLLGAPQAGGHV